MRLVGMALLAAWLLAWAASPHGEPMRQSSIVGAVAVAGGDEAGLAWLELRHGTSGDPGILHVAVLDEHDQVLPRLQIPVGADAVSFRIADAGAGQFVLVMEFRDETGRWFEFRRFQAAESDVPERRVIAAQGSDPGQSVRRRLEGDPGQIRAGLDEGPWQIAAAGDELVLAEEVGDGSVVHVLGAGDQWMESQTDGRTLLGSGAGHVVRYEVGRHADRLVVAPSRAASWAAGVSHFDCGDDPVLAAAQPAIAPTCGAERCPTVRTGNEQLPPSVVTSVVGLRGGYARFARRGAVGCIDGLRDGKPFQLSAISLRGFDLPRLSADDAGHLAIVETRDGQLAHRQMLIPELGVGTVNAPRPTPSLVNAPAGLLRSDEAVRYRLFGGTGKKGVIALATRFSDGESQVVLERHPAGAIGTPLSSTVLAPTRHYLPDHRPALRRLAGLPLLALLLSAFGTQRLAARLRRLRPSPTDRPLPSGSAVIEGVIALNADAPAGGLRVRRSGAALTLFLEGADVLRASQVRPRDQPRGDAVDVASGAAVVATGTVDAGTLFRGETLMRAGRGDLVIVGCTLAEARARVARRLFGGLVLFAAATALVLFLGLRG